MSVLKDFQLSRIYSTWQKTYFNIFLCGYNKNNPKKLLSYKIKFYDYFYFEKDRINQLQEIALNNPGIHIDKQKQFTSLYEKIVYKVFYTDRKTYRQLNNLYKNQDCIMMSDIKPHQKFLFQNKDNIKWSLNRHIIYIDIENYFDKKNPLDNKPQRAYTPITSIQLYSSFHDQYFIMSWHPDKTYQDGYNFYKEGNINYLLCSDEQRCLNTFINVIQDLKPDVLTGWYSKGFDIPYIINRCKVLEIPIERISPTRNLYIKRGDDKKSWFIYMDGIEHLDMMQLVQKMNLKLTDNKLSTLAKQILKEDSLLKIQQVTWKDWIPNYEGFIKYGIRDVQILKQVDNLQKILMTFFTVQSITNIDSIQKISSQTYTTQCNIMNRHWEKTVMPNKKQNQKKHYMGGYVKPPNPGLHKNVAVLDFASLYPTTMTWSNVSSQTFITSQLFQEENNRDINDTIKYLKDNNIDYVDTGYSDQLINKRNLFLAHNKKRGVISSLQKQMFLLRKQIKKQMKNYSEDDYDYSVYDKQQYVYKILLNACYGAFASTYFRFFSVQIAQTITYFARQSIRIAQKYFFENGYQTLYIDTDSLFIKLYDDTLEQQNKIRDLGEKFTNYIKNKLILKHNSGFDEEFFFTDLQVEKFLSHIYWSHGKKRYFGIRSDNQSPYIRGLNIIRKDTPQFFKQKLMELVYKSMYQTITTNQLQEVRQLLKGVKYEQLGVIKTFNKSFDQYKNMPQHLKSAKWADQKLGTYISQDDTPFLFYIKSKCQDDLPISKRRDAICIKRQDLNLIDQRTDIFQIDYQKYFDKQIIKPLTQFQLINQVSKSLLQYKINHSDYYKLRPKTTCPICNKKHLTSKSAKNCAKKYNNTKNKDIEVIKMFIQYIKQFSGC